MTGQNGEFAGSFAPTEVLEIAEAIAQRETHEFEIAQGLVSGITGQEPAQLPDGVGQKIMIARTAMLIRTVEDPTAVTGLDETMDILMRDSYGDFAAEMSDASGREVTEGQARDFLKGIGEAVLEDANVDGDYVAQTFAKTFTASKHTAEEHGVGVAEVYRDDALFAESFRNAFSPEEFVAGQLRMRRRISEKTTKAMLVHLADTLLPADGLDEIPRDKRASVLETIQGDPAVQQRIEQAVANGRSTDNYLTVAKIIRMWGRDRLLALPEDMQAEIGVSENPLAS